MRDAVVSVEFYSCGIV